MKRNAMLKRSEDIGYGNILPPLHWKHRHTIGNNLHTAFEVLAMHGMTGNRDYLRVARRQLDYLLGANPLDKIYVTGMEPNDGRRGDVEFGRQTVLSPIKVDLFVAPCKNRPDPVSVDELGRVEPRSNPLLTRSGHTPN